MSVRYTEEQQRAVDARGKVIVSASAGSGKTFVMIERLVSLILNGADVREILAVTFTNKAAAQMREKLRKALLEKIGQTSGEERRRLKDQLSALPLAEISTIHAFCGRLVRSHFFLAGVDPAFRIISPTDAEGKEISACALEETFDEAYGQKDEAFMRLLSVYFRRKKDSALRSAVLALHAKYRGIADYRTELAKVGTADLFEEACAYLAEDIRSRAVDIASEAAELGVFFAENPRALRVCTDVSAAATALFGGELFSLCEVEAPAISRMPPSTKAQGEELKSFKRLSALSAAVKGLYAELRKYSDRETEYARYLDANERSRALAGLVLRYDEKYERLKAEKGVLDYDDLEHCALRILEDETVLSALREKYRFVFVDEYQDVNPAQERIINLVGGEDVFLVGDRKQSIYSFRGSKSEYFTRKTQAFEHVLYLTRNFRSSVAVLDTVNRVFCRAMTEETCGFSYRDGSVLCGGDRYGVHGGEVLFHTVEEEKAEKNAPSGIYSVLSDEGMREKDAQAEAIAAIIEKEIGSVWYDADEGIEKRVTYGDIAVLVRKKTGEAARVVAALSERNIPVTTTAKVNIFDFWEARILCDLLSYLDNAEQDIPLASALLSSLGGFTEEDLAGIRLRFPSAWFFRKACREYAIKMADGLSLRLRNFFEKFERLRTECAVRTAGEMLNLLLAEGMEAEILAKKDGVRRMRRVRRLIAEAEGSVHEFLYRLSRMENTIEFSEAGGEDAVQVVTMHASKGLEYPVVIVADLETSFHGAEREEVMWTEKFSVAPKSFDAERKIMYETVLRRASALYEEREALKGELNLLYVAMTRAKYRLHMLFGENERAFSLRYAKRFSDFIDRDDCADYFVREESEEKVSLQREALLFHANGEKKARILEEYAKSYPYAASTVLPVKSSATELMKELRPTGHFTRSDDSEDSAVSTQTGTAYHAFLEYTDFTSDAESELSRMREKGLLSEEQIALLDLSKLKEILAIPCFRELSGTSLFREQKFLVRLQADELMDTDVPDGVVFQGAIDLLSIGKDGATIIDYKYSSHSDERIRSDYALQIKLYKKAVARALRIDESTVRARIVNIRACREIQM